MNVQVEELVAKATHGRCVMCDELVPLDVYGITEPNMDDFSELVCGCDEPYIVPVIVSDTPLFPPDDPDGELNADYFHFGMKKYMYDLGDDFFDRLEAQG